MVYVGLIVFIIGLVMMISQPNSYYGHGMNQYFTVNGNTEGGYWGLAESNICIQNPDDQKSCGHINLKIIGFILFLVGFVTMLFFT